VRRLPESRRARQSPRKSTCLPKPQQKRGSAAPCCSSSRGFARFSMITASPNVSQPCTPEANSSSSRTLALSQASLALHPRLPGALSLSCEPSRLPFSGRASGACARTGIRSANLIHSASCSASLVKQWCIQMPCSTIAPSSRCVALCPHEVTSAASSVHRVPTSRPQGSLKSSTHPPRGPTVLSSLIVCHLCTAP